MDTDPWRHRARKVMEGRLRGNGDDRPRYVVCGQDPLAFRLVNELVAASATVTVIVPTRSRSDGPDMRSIKGIRLLRADRLNERTFRAAGLVGAKGLALINQDDVGNIHAALCAQEVEPDLRVVMRMFNTRLGNRVKRLLPDCEVLSDATMAAPAFVAAALGEVSPTHFRHGGRTLHVAKRSEVRPEHVVCGLADLRDAGNPRVLPADHASADLVLAEAAGVQLGPVIAARRIARARQRARLWRDPLRALRSFATRKIGIATLTVLAVVLVFGVMLAREVGSTVPYGLYLTLVMTLSGADPEPDLSSRAQVLQVVLSLAGLALIPLLTAAVVDGAVKARLALVDGRTQTERHGHVVVVGLGNVGTRVMWQLHDLGIEVVAVDRDPDSRGAAVARDLGIPLIIGDGSQEETLRDASVANCRALVVVSTDDVTNLQAALYGREINSHLRIVLRLFDGDFAHRLQRVFNIGVSRSVSYLAAPAFAAALMDREVIATIPVNRHVLLVAEVIVAAGSALDGRTLAAVGVNPGVRVVAFAQFGEPGPIWLPPDGYRLRARDRVTVVARRSGLSWLLKQASDPPPPPTDPVA
ncbi:NAD-binding protein [Solwaraspora sp. WMMD406]|uniref:potassium channel protein n=1 Tax=Solwaraspora sp. WMMD406 TaxID=3016095 RepID=UPI002417FFA8|nr:NAD-binding protein [Solwaraspora sp. WMMD406]MDG4768315.1 NAD-binding protein [Solwaraspora sp. WMMD406]